MSLVRRNETGVPQSNVDDRADVDALNGPTARKDPASTAIAATARTMTVRDGHRSVRDLGMLPSNVPMCPN
jgi:hypothetical protein